MLKKKAFNKYLFLVYDTLKGLLLWVENTDLKAGLFTLYFDPVLMLAPIWPTAPLKQRFS